MSTSTKTVSQPLVSLQLPDKVGDLLAHATSVAEAMTANPSFPNPSPPLTALNAAIADLRSAQTAVLTRAKGTVSVRNQKRAALVTLLRQLGGHVQTTADATPETAAAVIESTGFAVRKVGAHAPRAYDVKPGPVAGSVVVTSAVAAHRASYEWQYSTDGGKTWVDSVSTLSTKATIAGVPSGAAVSFRHRAVTKAGIGDWSQPLSLLVK
jgi:hypothetical protein